MVEDASVVPFVIACGACCYCSKSLFAACETTNPQTGEPTRVPSSPVGTVGRAGLFLSEEEDCRKVVLTP